MCNPLAIGMALSAAGGAVKGVQNQQFVRAQGKAAKGAERTASRAREAERGRQQGFDTEMQGIHNTTRDGMTAGQHAGARDAFISEMLARYERPKNADDMGIPSLPGQTDATPEVQQVIAARANKAASDARVRMAALAKLASYGAADQGRGLALGAANDQIRTLGGLRSGSMTVANQEQSISPVTVRPGSTLIADMLSGAGSLISGGAGGSGLGSALANRNAMSGANAMLGIM
jgi:hypothetical protein